MINGEYWIQPGGFTVFADGETSDTNHEMEAFNSAIGLDADTLEKLYRDHKIEISAASYHIPFDQLGEVYAEENDIDTKDMDEADVEELGTKWLEENNANAKFIKWMIEGGNDAREYMLEHEGWIRVKGDNFEVWELDDGALDAIKSSDLWNDVDDPEEVEVSEDEAYINELSTGKSFNPTFRELFEAKHAWVIKGERGPEKVPGYRETTRKTSGPGDGKWLYGVGDNPRRRHARRAPRSRR